MNVNKIICANIIIILPMVFKPASAQQISSVYQSIAKEFGNLTFGP